MTKKIAKIEETRLRGIPVCEGVAIGSAFLFIVPDEEIPEFDIEDRDIENEIARYRKALARSKQEVSKLKTRLEKARAWDGVAILDSHLHMLADPTLTENIEEQIRSVRKNTEAVVQATMDEYQRRFNKISDTFFQERFKDVQDVSRRIIRHLQDQTKRSFADLPNDSIIFAKELSPSDTAEAKSTKIGAFVTQKGGATSHAAIVAKAQGVPYVASVELGCIDLSKHRRAIVDGFTGEVILNPTEGTLSRYQERLGAWKKRTITLHKQSFLPATTLDGKEILLKGNIEQACDINRLHELGALGVGLFRSESLLLTQGQFPSEEEQFYIYKTLVQRMQGLPITLRTFDIGGDKFGRFYRAPKEDNPFLGCRAIRLFLKERDLFKVQLRAMLRASHFGKVHILFPMISTLQELLQAKALLQESVRELDADKMAFDHAISIGCMIEVPSAALISDMLAPHCNFFSIGTNDLVQYCIAVDRGNQALNYLYNPLHPAVLRLIKMVVQTGKRFNIPVSVCGEMAADPNAIEALLGLGIEELSISPTHIPLIKDKIRSIDLTKIDVN